jgi:hypothetical protein
VDVVSPALLALETQDLAASSRVLRHWVAAPLEASATRLAKALEGCAAMAGSDPGGVAWAASYDRAARTALSATADAINAVDKLAAMFAQTARNYEAADAASTASDRRLIDAAVESLPSVGPSFWLSSCTPSAAGGSGGGPPGWSLIEHLVGHVWPDGHQDRLRAAAQAWATSADTLQRGADDVTGAPQLAISDRLPEAEDMWAVCHGVAGHVYDLASVHRALAAACEQLAGHIDDAHATIEHELAGLVEWSVGIEVTGALVSVFTLGIAEGPTQVAETARIAASANRVAAWIERFIALARTCAHSVAELVERAGAVSARLRVVLEARLSAAAVTTVGRLRQFSRWPEPRALGRLTDDDPHIALRCIDQPKRFDPMALEGMTMDDVRVGIPRSWDREPSKTGGGTVFRDPANRGRYVRLMPGYAKGIRSARISEGPYAVVAQNGVKVKIALAGNPTLR